MTRPLIRRRLVEALSTDPANPTRASALAVMFGMAVKLVAAHLAIALKKGEATRCGPGQYIRTPGV